VRGNGGPKRDEPLGGSAVVAWHDELRQVARPNSATIGPSANWLRREQTLKAGTSVAPFPRASRSKRASSKAGSSGSRDGLKSTSSSETPAATTGLGSRTTDLRSRVTTSSCRTALFAR
jgi:hypothetical protein